MELRIKLICIEDINKNKISFDFLGKRIVKPIEKVKEIVFSKSFGNNGSIIRHLGLPLDTTINNGEFKIKPEWIPKLQPYFGLNLKNPNHIYYIEFVYRKF